MLRILILFIFFMLGCGFEDNLPCRSDECDENQEELPKTEDEG